MNCPKCNSKLVIEIEITGGCYAHQEGEYCYCDDVDIHAELVCINRVNNNKKYCGFRKTPVAGLADQYSISRWLSEHYTED